MRTRIALSKIKILPDDVFLVSYPRSGNTWTSLLLSNYVSEMNYDDHGLSSSLVAELYRASPEALAQKESPRVIKIHASYEPSLPKVIYLVRDARDVAVSYYFFYQKFKGEEISFEDYLPKFNSGELDRFGVWNYHVNSWLNQREGQPDFLLVRYEDLKENTHKQLSRMVKFIWGEVNDERIDIAVKATEISRLQESEKRSNWFEGTNENINFFRKGIVGDWENHFTPDSLRDFTLFHGQGLKRLGYISGALSTSSEETNAPAELNSTAFDLQIYCQQESLYEVQEQVNRVRDQLRKERQKNSEDKVSSNTSMPSREAIIQPSSVTPKSQKKLRKKVARIQRRVRK